MPAYQTEKVLPKKAYPEAEGWEYLEGSYLKRSRSACVCITCQHFDYSCEKDYMILLTCQIQEQLIPHREPLNSRCPLWHKRIESQINQSPEVS